MLFINKRFLLIVFAFVSLRCQSQTYVSLVPSLTNTAGTLAGKSNIAIEIGRQWDAFSMGLDVGKTSMGKVTGRDTTAYLELRPNLNVFQQGKFTNTFTAGIGYIFQAKENLMTELTSGIEYAASEQLHFNVFFGQYYYSGRVSASNVTFFGLSVMAYFSKSHPKPLIRQGQEK
jgi:hypothetical protein